MNSGKTVGPRREPWGTSSLAASSYEHFPFRTTWSCLSMRREKIDGKYLTWNSTMLMFLEKTTMPNPVQSLGYIKCYSLSSADLSKALVIRSETIARRSAIDQKDLKPYQISEKRPHCSRWSTKLLFTSFSKILLTTEGRLTRQKFLSLSNIPKFRDHRWDLQTTWKTRFFRHIFMKSSTNMFKI